MKRLIFTKPTCLLLIFLFAVSVTGLSFCQESQAEQAYDLYDKIISMENPQKMKQVLEENKSSINPLFLKALDRTAAEYLKSRKYKLAMTNLAILASSYGVLEDKKNLAGTLIILGNAASKLKKRALVKKFFKEAISIARELNDNELKARAGVGIADAQLSFFQLKKSRATADRARQIAEKLSDTKVKGEVFARLGFIYSSLNEKQKSSECYEEAKKIATKLSDKDLMSSIDILMAWEYLKIDKRDMADQSLKKAEDHYKQSGQDAKLADCKIVRGFVTRLEKKMADSTKNFTQAQEIYKKMGSEVKEGEVLQQLAVNNVKEKNVDKAIENLQEARYLFNNAGSVDNYLDSLVWLSAIFNASGKPEIAEGYALEANDGFKASGFVPGEIASVLLLIDIYRQTGDQEKFNNFYNQIKQIKKDLGKNSQLYQKIFFRYVLPVIDMSKSIPGKKPYVIDMPKERKRRWRRRK